jgi:thiamine-phosphate pyrophosphorylase
MATLTNQGKSVLPSGIYGMTAGKFSRGRSNIEVVRQMIAGGATIIQYREKRPHTSHRDMLDECNQLRAITRRHGVVFIVNDHVDIAMLTDADGVHVGQDDLPVDQVRKLVGPDKIIGLSTHSPQQAQAAMAAGADYIGVGPIFTTRTKEDVCDPVGLEYLAYAVKHVTIPFVAIGGIKRHNIEQVRRLGAKTICLVTEIVGADDIAGMVRTLLAQMAACRMDNRPSFI